MGVVRTSGNWCGVQCVGVGILTGGMSMRMEGLRTKGMTSRGKAMSEQGRLESLELEPERARRREQPEQRETRGKVCSRGSSPPPYLTGARLTCRCVHFCSEPVDNVFVADERDRDRSLVEISLNHAEVAPVTRNHPVPDTLSTFINFIPHNTHHSYLLSGFWSLRGFSVHFPVLPQPLRSFQI